MSNIKNGGLDQYGAGPFEQQQFGTAGVEGVNVVSYQYGWLLLLLVALPLQFYRWSVRLSAADTSCPEVARLGPSPCPPVQHR